MPHLERVWLSDKAAIERLVLGPEQELFAGSIDTIFDDLRTSKHPDHEHAFAIVAQGVLVGFFVLREKARLPGWAPAEAITLHSFRISRDRQGEGFGRAGIELAIAWINENRPTAKRLMLAVNARNGQARAVYLRCGFFDTGMRVPGAIGEQHILTSLIPLPNLLA